MVRVARHRWYSAVVATAATVCLSVPALAKVHFSVLYEFTGGADGDGAGAALVSDPAGTLYGSSSNGGTFSCGTGATCGSIFSLTKTGATWTFATLHSLNGMTDGAQPANDQIVRGTDGSLYGTAPLGGSAPFPGGGGVVWKLSPSGGSFTYSVLHSFAANDPAGFSPVAGLAMDSASVLYGITTQGSVNSTGAVFSLTPGAGGAYTEAVLSPFGKGKPPSHAVRAPTLSSNELRLFAAAAASGVVFELHRTSGSTPWVYHTIAKFGSTAANFSNLVGNTNGKLFGTVAPGGQFGLGEAFELTQPAAGTGAQWTITAIANFGAVGGHTPAGPIVQGRLGQLFGTVAGMPNTIYQLTPPAAGSTTWTVSSVQNLDATSRGVLTANGVYPTVGGALAGTTLTGGAANKGVIFRQSTH